MTRNTGTGRRTGRTKLLPLSCRGFTLIELIITIVLLGFVSLILIPFTQSIIHSPDPMLRQRAISLGQAMMDEIMAKKWDHNTPLGGGPICTDESDDARSSIEDCSLSATAPGDLGPHLGEFRTTFNDVDDYAFYDANSEIDTFTDQNGETFEMKGFKRRVKVFYIDSSSTTIDHNTPAVAGTTTDTKLVVVTVESPRGEIFHFVSVACNL